LIDHKAARLLWDLIQMEIEKTEWKENAGNTRRNSEKNTGDPGFPPLPNHGSEIVDMTIRYSK